VRPRVIGMVEERVGGESPRGNGRFLLVGRHNLTERQKELLKKVGLEKMVTRIETVNNPIQVVAEAKRTGAEAIVVQGLPMHIMASIINSASREGMPVLAFEMEQVGLVSNESEIPENAEVVLPSREGTIRILRTARLVMLKRVVIEKEVVAE